MEQDTNNQDYPETDNSSVYIQNDALPEQPESLESSNKPTAQERPHSTIPKYFIIILIAAVVIILYVLFGYNLHINSGPSNHSALNSSAASGKVTTYFEERGLPNGTLWSMSYYNQGNSSTSDTITFKTATGRYFFSVNPLNVHQLPSQNASSGCFTGLYPSPLEGDLNASQTQIIVFSNTTHCGT